MIIVILTILQVLGIALAAGAAIANLLKSKGIEEIRTPSLIYGGADSITRRLTREAKIGVWCLIAGVTVSLVAKIVEQYLNNKSSRETQQANTSQLQRAGEQLRLARKSLMGVERLLTRFDSISFAITYQLDPTNVCFSPLVEWAKTLIPSDLETNSHTSNIRGSHEEGSNTVSFSLSSDFKEITCQVMPEILSNRFNTNSLPKPAFEELLNFIFTPKFAVIFYAADNADAADTPDLYLPVSNLSQMPLIIYNRELRTLLISWNFDCPQSDWGQTKRIRSLPDLANAECYHCPLFVPTAMSTNIRPFACRITFDLTPINIWDFEIAGRRNGNSFNARVHKMILTSIGEPPPFLGWGMQPILWDHLYRSQLPSEEKIVGIK